MGLSQHAASLAWIRGLACPGGRRSPCGKTGDTGMVCSHTRSHVVSIYSPHQLLLANQAARPRPSNIRPRPRCLTRKHNPCRIAVSFNKSKGKVRLPRILDSVWSIQVQRLHGRTDGIPVDFPQDTLPVPGPMVVTEGADGVQEHSPHSFRCKNLIHICLTAFNCSLFLLTDFSYQLSAPIRGGAGHLAQVLHPKLGGCAALR